ncbi:hypothetical protein C8046_06170 [Serinibacter arcticus]|uniref:Lipoprotein n=1 Tax=Serinibacter arcticus TaxID=1655435 RepID=A0A2U1ZTJ0_9MICO|nr:hypothetical protein [Serinibacter arcticus]PWD50305.1 hypothetical protein C8046_06170 [Serinibacter arcticus]
MRRHVILSAVLVCFGLSSSACSSDPAVEYEGVTPAEFVQVACSDWLDYHELEETNRDLPLALAGTGEEQRAEALAAGQAQLDRLSAARDAISESTPAVADGADVIAPFVSYYDGRLAVAEPRLEEFTTFPTELSGHDDQVQIEAIDLFQDMSRHGEGAPTNYPFTEVEDEEIIEAYADESSCATLVTVTRY